MGVITPFRNVRAGNPQGPIPDGQRGAQKWRDLKQRVLDSLGAAPRAWLDDQPAAIIDVPASNAPQVVNSLANNDRNVLDQDSQEIEDNRMKTNKFLGETGVSKADIKEYVIGLKRAMARLPHVYVPRAAPVPAADNLNGHILKLLPTMLPPSFSLCISILKNRWQSGFANLPLAGIITSLNARLTELINEGKYKVSAANVTMVDPASNMEDFIFATAATAPAAAPQTAMEQQVLQQPRSLKRPNDGKVLMSKSTLKKKLKKARTEAIAMVTQMQQQQQLYCPPVHDPSSSSSSAVFAAKGKGSNSRSLQSDVCRICGRRGHWDNECWHNPANKGNGKGNQNQTTNNKGQGKGKGNFFGGGKGAGKGTKAGKGFVTDGWTS